MKLLTNEEIEKSIQHLSQIKQAMRAGKIAKSEKDTKSGLPKLVFTERTADELSQAMLEIKHYKSKVEEMQKAFEGIHRIASETFESHNQLELIRLTAVEHLKGGETK